MDFPHLKDNNFPHINTVDTFKYQNDFDYGRWTGKVSIKLLNVLWNSNYADVPGFVTDEERDEWFDEQPGLVKTLESAFNITPENSVKIPVPYNDAYRFNYLVVDMPMQTSFENPIDYENASTRVSRWYYFIDNMTQYAPNTTELIVTLDVWTTFVNTVNIPYLMLERGHAPMMLSDIDSYLENPLENSEYLLAEDFNYGRLGTDVIKSSKFYPIGAEKKYVLFACPISPNNIQDLGGYSYSGNSTAPTFLDSGERWGHSLIVNDYEWKYGSASYSNANLPVETMASDGNTFNGNFIYAIPATTATGFFTSLAANKVHLLNAITACFIVSSDMIELGTTLYINNYLFYSVVKQDTIIDIALEKSDFDFGENYERITKLYTYPYSVLEFTDDNGITSEIRIENISEAQLHKELSIAFPFIRYQIFLSGINGEGVNQYTWVNLRDERLNKEMWESDFSKFMVKWDIPTYAIIVSAERKYAVDNYPQMDARRTGAIIDYQNSARLANTDAANMWDSDATLKNNRNLQNDSEQAITAQNVATARANVARQNTALAETNVVNQRKLEDDLAADLTYSASCFGIDAAVSTAITNVNAVAAVDASGMSGVVQSFGGDIIGGLSGLVGSVVQSGAAQASNTIAIGGNLQNTIAASGYQSTKTLNAETNMDRQVDITARCNTDTNENSCNAASTNTGTNCRYAALQTVNTANTNDSNATYGRDALLKNAQENLAQVQREAESQYIAHRLREPFYETDYNGDAFPDVFQRRGIRLNVRTQTKSAIAQAGDAMLRFGYALHRVWDMSNGLHYGKHFTFWKAEDIWINEGNGLAGSSVNVIGDIFLKGVTVWRNPDEIGKVRIYDNM